MRKLTKHSMQGASIFGLMFVLLCIVFLVLIGMNLIPPYMDNYAIKDAISQMASDPATASLSKAKLRDLFIRKLQVNSIRNLSPDALTLEKRGEKSWLILKYENRVHLIGNIDAVLSFDEQVQIE